MWRSDPGCSIVCVLNDYNYLCEAHIVLDCPVLDLLPNAAHTNPHAPHAGKHVRTHTDSPSGNFYDQGSISALTHVPSRLFIHRLHVRLSKVPAPAQLHHTQHTG